MNVGLTDSERKQLRQWQKQRRDNDGYVKVTVLLLDKGRSAARVAGELGLDEATVYRSTSRRSWPCLKPRWSSY